MRYSQYMTLLVGTCLISSVLHAARINTIPLDTNGQVFAQTPITSSSGSATMTQQAPVQAQTNLGTQNTQEAQLNAWMIEAAQAAKEYVDLLDKGQYAQSWSVGDPLFQRVISQPEWTKALQIARSRLGNVVSRTVKDQRPAFDPKGLPKGPYMVVEYNTSFGQAPQSGELLTLRLGPDSKWRVVTYQVN